MYAGTLLVNGTNGAGVVDVWPGATLGGSGLINGPVSVSAGATLAPGGQGALRVPVAPAPGGGYSHFGRLAIGDFEVVCTLKTVWGIISHRHVMMDHHFEFCDPAFPDNLIDFVKLAAHNAQRCFELAHNRMWNRHRREHRY